MNQSQTKPPFAYHAMREALLTEFPATFPNERAFRPYREAPVTLFPQ